MNKIPDKPAVYETIPIVFNGVTYNIPIPIAEGWCRALSIFEGKKITIDGTE